MTFTEYLKKMGNLSGIINASIAFTICLAGMVVFNSMQMQTMLVIFAFFTWVLIFSIFDSVGYGYAIWYNKLWYLSSMVISNNIVVTDINYFLYPYRIIQNIFHWYTLTILALIDYRISLMCATAWWFGLADYFYYLILDIKIDDELPWMENWSVHMILKPLGIKCTSMTFILFSYIGLVLSFLILTLI